MNILRAFSSLIAMNAANSINLSRSKRNASGRMKLPDIVCLGSNRMYEESDFDSKFRKNLCGYIHQVRD